MVLERLSFNDTTIATCVWANIIILLGAFALALLALLVMRERHMAVDPLPEGSDTAAVVTPAPSAGGPKNGRRHRGHQGLGLGQDHRRGRDRGRGAEEECKDATIDGTYASRPYDTALSARTALALCRPTTLPPVRASPPRAWTP